MHSHVLLVVFPAQGHISPALELAKKIIRNGVEVTFSTSLSSDRRMTKPTEISKGLNFAPFAEANDAGKDDKKDEISKLNHGSETLRELIRSCAEQGRPFSRLIYTNLLPWAAAVASEFHIPSVLFWTQPVTTLDIYYSYFNGYGDEIKNVCSGTNSSIQLPGLPLLSSRDFPSFMLPSSPFKPALQIYREHLKALDAEAKPTVLVSTCDALEAEPIRAIEKYKMVGVGPLIPSETSFGSDLLRQSKDCLGWMNSQPHKTVVYVSFGSHPNLSKAQKEEIAGALLECGRPFLWVMTTNENGEEKQDKLSCMQELEQQGMIVPWCSQLEVLKHPSLGCFLTHCGWNSSLESIVCGVPMIAFPQMFDQTTIAKLIEDVWKIGARVTPNGNGTAESEEIKRCIELVMDVGEKGKELRENLRKWRSLTMEAMEEGGSPDKNLKAFLAELEDSFCKP